MFRDRIRHLDVKGPEFCIEIVKLRREFHISKDENFPFLNTTDVKRKSQALVTFVQHDNSLFSAFIQSFHLGL